MNPEQRSCLDKIAEEEGYDSNRIEVKEISSGGANFTSSLYSIVLSAPTKPELKLFAKISILSEELRSLVAFKIYNTEVEFYSDLLPKYRELEATHGVPDDETLLLPKYYGGSTDHMNEMIVLEDLSERGFKNMDRFACFDWDYASKSVEQLAILHSLSIAYAQKNPEEFLRLTENMQEGFSARSVKNFLDCTTAVSLNVCDEENKDKLSAFIKKTINDETFEKYAKPARRPGLIHGDFRPSNIMHRWDKNGNLQVAIVDHQLTQRGNPLYDIMYFIACGSDAAFRAKHFYQLMDHYYAQLSTSLARLGVCPEEVYSKEDFDKDVELFLPYGLMLAILLLPIVTVDEDKAPAKDDFLHEVLFEDGNDALKRRLNDVVIDFMKMGVL